MFKDILKAGYFAKLEKIATDTVIKEDRLLFLPVLKKIKETLIDDKFCVFSDSDILTSSINLTSKSLILYSVYARKTTTMLANIIHSIFGKFVQMRSIIPNDEYEILYNMRSIIKIYRIDKYKNINIHTLFKTVHIDGSNYFPVDIELLSIYQLLYVPNNYKQWDELKDTEIKLWDIYNKNRKIKGGGYSCTDCKTSRHIDISNIKMLLLNYLHNDTFVLVGDWVNYIKNTDYEPPDTVIQVISENDIDTDYKNILTYISKLSKFGIFYKKRKIYIPKNNRIVKYTIYIKYPSVTMKTNQINSGIDKPIIDIFNNASYELIPYEIINYGDKNIRIGNSYVLLYFLWMDLWILNLIKNLNGTDENSYNKLNDKLNTLIKKQRAISIKHISDKQAYTGINYDENIYQKLVITEKNLKKSSYYPELAISKGKKYKTIATS